MKNIQHSRELVIFTKGDRPLLWRPWPLQALVQRRMDTWGDQQPITHLRTLLGEDPGTDFTGTDHRTHLGQTGNVMICHIEVDNAGLNSFDSQKCSCRFAQGHPLRKIVAYASIMLHSYFRHPYFMSHSCRTRLHIVLQILFVRTRAVCISNHDTVVLSNNFLVAIRWFLCYGFFLSIFPLMRYSATLFEAQQV